MNKSVTMNQKEEFKKNALPIHEFYYRILLVEDDSSSEDLIRMVCEQTNPRLFIKCVRTAEEAEKVLSFDSRFDLIVSDHFLNGPTTGFDLWRKCHKNYVWIPFVMTTGLEPIELIRLAGNDPDYPYFLSKPINNKEFSRVVAHYLRRNM